MLENSTGKKNMFHYNLKNDLYLSDEDIAEMVLTGASCCIDISDVTTDVINLLYNANILKDADKSPPGWRPLDKGLHWVYIMSQQDDGTIMVELTPRTQRSTRYVTPVVDVELYRSGCYAWCIQKGHVYGLTK